MRIPFALLLGFATAAMPIPTLAEVPDWMSGNWRTNARLTAPDGAQLRIRCTLTASAAVAADNDDTADGDGDWAGTLGCATVQGRFEGTWDIAITGESAAGDIIFSGTETAELSVSGTASETHMDLESPDGQGVAFTPGPDGALVVEMNALGPQRLTGALTFETR